MKDRNITITISAPAGNGKTTIAEMFHRFLIEQGFDSTYTNPDSTSVFYNDHYDERLNIIKEDATITIVEKQSPRPGIRTQG